MTDSTVSLTQGKYEVVKTMPNAMRSPELLEHLTLEVRAWIADPNNRGGKRASPVCEYLSGVLGVS